MTAPDVSTSATDIADLAASLRGEALSPTDPSYDKVRAVWNAMIDRRPAAIVRARDVGDVERAVAFARKEGLAIAVRGGGHNIAGAAVCDGGLMIDLSPMRSVEVDPEDRTVRVEGGATLVDLDGATQKFGLATPAGVVSSTGVAGLTLGGGFGWLSRKYGLTADNLLSVEIVTADGARLTASESENVDLFWGVRGGGGNFGVVTSFVFRLHEVGPQVLFGPTLHRLEDAADVLRHYRDFALAAPRECCVWADILTAPPLPFIPERHHGRKVLSLMQCYAGDPEDGEAALAPLRAFGQPIADAVGPTSYVAAQKILDDAYAKGARNYWKSSNFEVMPDHVLDAVVKMGADLPTPQSDVLICHLGGAIADVPPDATAYPHRRAAFALTPGVRWHDPSMDETCVEWLRRAFASLDADTGGGAYVNFVAETEGRERDAYGSNYERLVALKKQYDQQNIFRFNQNVRPTNWT